MRSFLKLLFTALIAVFAAMVFASTPEASGGYLMSGVILNGILGGVKGKVGGVVGANWKGINYLRSYAIPANPNTASQQASRSKLKFVGETAKLILATIIQPYWNPFYSNMSGFNGFSKVNIPLISAADDYANLMITQGSLEGDIIGGTHTYNATSGLVTVSFEASTMGNGLGTDPAFLLVIDAANNAAFLSDGSDTRVGGEINISIGGGRTASDLHAFLFFARGSGDTLEVSPSAYTTLSAT